MALTLEEVEHVADLARLGLTDEEKVRLRDELSSILDHIAVLNRLDTSAIPPTAQVIPLQNVMRPDEVGESLPRERVLANAPHEAEGFFEVLAVLGGEGSEEVPS